MTDSTRQFERDRLFKKWGQFKMQDVSEEDFQISDEGSVFGGKKEDKFPRAESPEEEDLNQITSKVKTYESFDEYLFNRSQDHSPNINKEGILKYNNFDEYLERRLKSDLLFSTAQKEIDGNDQDVPLKLYKDDYFKMFVKEAFPDMRKEEYANLSASQDPTVILALIDLSPLLRDRGSDLCYLNFSKYLERQWKQKQYFDADQPSMDFKHYTEHCRQNIAPEMSEKEFKKEILSPDSEDIRNLIERCPRFVTREPASIERRRGSDSSQDSDLTKENSDISSTYSSGCSSSDSDSDSDSDEEDDLLAEMRTKANQVAAARKDQKRLSISMSAGAIPNTTMSPNVGFSNKSLSSTQDTPNSTVSLGRRASSAKLTLKAFKLHSHESSRKK